MCQELGLLEATGRWPGLRSVAMVETLRMEGGLGQTSTRFYISSLEGQQPAAYAGFIRGHWGIENQLHWHLDVSFGEDRSQVRKGNGPQNLSAIRKMALFMIGRDNAEMSVKRKRKKAARDNNFLLKLFKNP